MFTVILCFYAMDANKRQEKHMDAVLQQLDRLETTLQDAFLQIKEIRG
jgi:hypothetical protein